MRRMSSNSTVPPTSRIQATMSVRLPQRIGHWRQPATPPVAASLRAQPQYAQLVLQPEHTGSAAARAALRRRWTPSPSSRGGSRRRPTASGAASQPGQSIPPDAAGPDHYFDRECSSHTAQGDLYAGVPFVWRTVVTAADDPPAGKRPRPAIPDTSEGGLELIAVCNYTCGFMAQPPGTPGYAHPFRLVAPILPLQLLRDSGITDAQLEGLVANGGANGFTYLPSAPFGFREDPDSRWAGHAAACLYRSRRWASPFSTPASGSAGSPSTRTWRSAPASCSSSRPTGSHQTSPACASRIAPTAGRVDVGATRWRRR